MHVCGWSCYTLSVLLAVRRVRSVLYRTSSTVVIPPLKSRVWFVSRRRPLFAIATIITPSSAPAVERTQRRLLLAYRARVTHLSAGRARCPTTNVICCDCSWQVLMTSVNALWTYEIVPLEFRRLPKKHLFSWGPWRPIVTCFWRALWIRWMKIRKTLYGPLSESEIQ